MLTLLFKTIFVRLLVATVGVWFSTELRTKAYHMLVKRVSSSLALPLCPLPSYSSSAHPTPLTKHTQEEEVFQKRQPPQEHWPQCVCTCAFFPSSSPFPLMGNARQRRHTNGQAPRQKSQHRVGTNESARLHPRRSQTLIINAYLLLPPFLLVSLSLDWLHCAPICITTSHNTTAMYDNTCRQMFNTTHNAPWFRGENTKTS
jgi:hypothetical protein